jgi:hypothetical protein
MIKTTVTDNRVMGRETCRKRGKAEKAGFKGNQTNHDKIMSYGYCNTTSTVLCYFARRARRTRGRGHSRPVLNTDRQSESGHPTTGQGLTRSDPGHANAAPDPEGPSSEIWVLGICPEILSGSVKF